MVNPFNNIIDQADRVIHETDTTIFTNESNMSKFFYSRYLDWYINGYDGTPEPGTISATEFTGSDKQILLKQERYTNPYKITVDVADIVASSMGTKLHELFMDTGEPPRQFLQITDQFKISGGADRIETPEGKILLTLEEIVGSNGTVYDLKTTSSFVAKRLLNELDRMGDEKLPLTELKEKYPAVFKYTIQLSIYNLLYKLNSTIAYLQILITNWSQMNANELPGKHWTQVIDIYSKEETLAYITNRVQNIEKYISGQYMPECTPIEQGLSDFKQYKICKIGKTRRIPKTEIYNSISDALAAQSASGVIGTEVVTVSSSKTPFLCTQYCPYNIDGVCEQGQLLKAQYQQ